jgi:CRP-like cAMP-binding protein
VTVRLGAGTPPAVGAEILQLAILNTRLILATPTPLVAVKSVSADGTQFDIDFYVEELAQSTRAQNELFDWISRHLAAAGIALASNQSPPAWLPPAAIPDNPKTAPERALDLVDLFSGLTQQERKMLAVKTTLRHYDAGEALVEPGKVLTSLFVIGAGVLSFTSAVSDGDIEILRIGPGDHFGEIGMLTGRPTQATARALAPVTIYELSKKDLRRCSRRGRKFRMKCAGCLPSARPQAGCSPRPRSTRACRRAGSRPGSPTGCIGCSMS